MKNVLFLIIFLIASYSYSQSLSLFDIDATNFPTIRGKFYAFDGAGKQKRPNIGELSITENGTVRTITNVSCPLPVPPKALSAVLVIDVSGSMSGNNIEIAKAAANLFVNALTLGNSECAITSFDDANYLNQDFTKNKTTLVNKIAQLQPKDGTDYDAAFINPKAGGLLISKKGENKKVIIMMTDGRAKEPKTQQIIQEANEQNCTVFCVTLGLKAPESLKEITKQTGGQIFENVTTIKEAEEIYNRILQISQGAEACTIEWISGISCESNNFTMVELSIIQNNITYKTTYKAHDSTLARLEFSPILLRFINPEIQKPLVQNFTITARNSVFIISNIKSINPSFEITPTNFTLIPNESIEVTVTYLAVDSNYKYSKIIVENNICNQSFFVTAEHIGVKSKIPTLVLTSPNGGENFIIGYDTLVKWEGIPPTEQVQIEYSIDNGSSWRYLDTSKGNSYNWKKISHPTSNKCLVRIKQVEEYKEDSVQVLRGHNNYLNNVKYSPDGSFYITVGGTSVLFWDAKSNQLIRSYENVFGAISSTAINNNNSMLAIGMFKKAIIIDLSNFQTLRIFDNYDDNVSSLAFSLDDSKLLTGCGDESLKLWNISNSNLLMNNRWHKRPVSSVSYNPKGNSFASCAENFIVWDSFNNDSIYSVKKITYNLSFSPDGNKFVTSHNDRSIKVWDAENRTQLLNLIGHKEIITSVIFSPDGNLIASSSGDKTIRLWDAKNGQLIRSLVGHTDFVTDLAFSPSGESLVSVSGDSSIRIWKINKHTIQEDQSDTVFSIVEPLAQSTSIALGEVLVGSNKDSVIIDFVRNIGTWEFRVDSIYIRGADAGAFSLVSGIPKYTVEANNSHFGEFRFTPNRVGVHTAEIVIITQSDTIVQTITGIGVEPKLQILANFIDFGEVEIGNERVVTDTLVIKNVSTTPITIDDTKLLSPDIEQFEILSGGGNFTLNAGDERPVTAKFKPKFGGRTSGRIGFEYNGVGSPAITQLFGTGIGGLVYVPNDSGYPGDRKSIRLVLANVKPEGIASIASKFRVTIRLKNSLVAPLDGSSTIILNDSMYITVSGSIGTTTELIQIPIIVGLGAIEYTYIDIVEFRLEDNNGNPVEYNFVTSSGIFTLLGICREGGSRLVFDNTVPYLLMVTPNPSEGNVEVDVNVIEEGTSALKIFNANGSLMEERIFTTLGNKKIAIDTKGYSNGLYFITLQTPTTFDKTKMLLVK